MKHNQNTNIVRCVEMFLLAHISICLLHWGKQNRLRIAPIELEDLKI